VPRFGFALVLLLALTGSVGGRVVAAGGCRAIAVAQGPVSYPHVSSVQAAVDEARPCDWVLVAPGIYHGPVTIKVPDLHLRGLDRNRVVIDGGHQVGNGITVEANGVWVENLTVRNFERESVNDDDTGNQVRWVGVNGWYGRYLTTYDTGLLGGYGQWASHSRDGVLDHVYASGFSDSGLYVGACRDCQAIVDNATAERNAIGLAATNASGHFLIEHSLFADNTVGLSFNSSLSDPPPPQLGTCAAGRNRSPSPPVTTTRLARCTIFRDNRVLGNNALDVPGETASVRPGAGIGIELLGAEADLIADNVVSDNRNIGVLGLPLPETGPTRFPLAGNRVFGNTISGSRLAIALAGGGERSVDDCIQGNSAGSSEPANLRLYSCAKRTTPSLPIGSSRRIDSLVDKLHDELVARVRRRQPPPPSQPSMPAPCRGAPPSPLCP